MSVGVVKLRYHREMVGTPKTATVVRYPSGKWCICISCEAPNSAVNDGVQPTGFDLGPTNYLTSSDGTVTERLRAARKA